MDWSKPDGYGKDTKSKAGNDMITIKIIEGDQSYFMLKNKFKQGYYKIFKFTKREQLLPEEHEEAPIKFEEGGVPF